MLFIKNERRPLVRSNPMIYMTGADDRCYLIYSEILRRWRSNPTWETANTIHFDFVMDTEDNHYLEDLYSKCPTTGWNELCNASSLAWQVFFALYVMPLTNSLRKENGDI